jgi:hypothetical protein
MFWRYGPLVRRNGKHTHQLTTPAYCELILVIGSKNISYACYILKVWIMDARARYWKSWKTSKVQLSMLPPRHSPWLGLQPLLRKLSIIATFIFSLLSMFQIKFQILNFECQVLSSECQVPDIEYWMLSASFQVTSVKYWISSIQHFVNYTNHQVPSTKV